MQFAQLCDLVESDTTDRRKLDISGLLGTWVNSNPDTTGITRMVISEAGENLSLRVQAIGPGEILDWGAADVRVFTSSPSSHVAAGFTSVYDFGFAETQLQAMILKGLIVLAQIHRFKDQSGRADYFVREYFALDHGRF